MVWTIDGFVARAGLDWYFWDLAVDHHCLRGKELETPDAPALPFR
jgi:hypothetical protein